MLQLNGEPIELENRNNEIISALSVHCVATRQRLGSAPPTTR